MIYWFYFSIFICVVFASFIPLYKCLKTQEKDLNNSTGHTVVVVMIFYKDYLARPSQHLFSRQRVTGRLMSANYLAKFTSPPVACFILFLLFSWKLRHLIKDILGFRNIYCNCILVYNVVKLCSKDIVDGAQTQVELTPLMIINCPVKINYKIFKRY